MLSGNYSVLVVDDEPDMLWVLEHTLRRSGYGVVTASNAFHALGCLKKQQFALAFIDMKLPDMDGLQLAKAIREIDVDIGIIMISGYYYATDAKIKHEFAQRQYFGFVAKPFSLADIREIALKALAYRDGSSPIPPHQ